MGEANGLLPHIGGEADRYKGNRGELKGQTPISEQLNHQFPTG
jgi:hypothetical protein